MPPINKKLQEVQTQKYIDRSNRFPRSFKEVARILRDVRVNKKNLRTAVYESKLKGQVLRKIYGLANSIITNMKSVDYVINILQLLEKEPKISSEVIQILVHEIIKNNRLHGNSYPVTTIKKYEENIKKVHLKFQTSSDFENVSPYIPRYARIQTITTTIADTITALKIQGYKQINVDGIKFSKYLDVIKNLSCGEFVQDFHFKDVLVFNERENLTSTNLYKTGCIFLYDKASYIPSFSLQPKPGSKVLDCCAAPGMKTAHLACLMKNTGKIYAFDRDTKRFAILENMMKKANIKNCCCLCDDFTNVDPNSKPYSDVQYILLDPSCSGSGMVERFIIGNYQKDPNRIQKLSRFQISMLKHALSFPKVRRIVYSTCSVHEEENEYVVQEALKEFSDIYAVVPAFPEWPFRGLNTYSFGHLCVRASVEKGLTNGFFVSAMARIDKKVT